MSFPYSYFRCSCADISLSCSRDGAGPEGTFDPRSKRSRFSLYPLDQLMWCEDCHDIRCPRCIVEEIVCWYCPSCLFEVASSVVKSEGNRCTRNCFSCPLCTAPLCIGTLNTESGGVAGPWILACEYCNWTTLEIGICFEKPTNVFSQLSRIQSGRSGQAQSKQSQEFGEHGLEEKQRREAEARFALLGTFYKSQLSMIGTSNHAMSPAGSLDYNSPSSLARIMSLYTGTSNYGKKATSKISLVRESTDSGEGLHVLSHVPEAVTVEKVRNLGWETTTDLEQRGNQSHKPRFVDEIWPVPTLLCTKRSKRCRACRHILVKPEAKVSSTRCRIKLMALNYVPSMAVKTLINNSTSALNLSALPPSRPIQFLLTVKNQLFDPIKVTLATPAQTQGRFNSRVTILCPQFEIGANTDVWDEALGGADNRQMSKLGKIRVDEGGDGKAAEAGKIWGKGRNWTIVVVELVCDKIGDGNGTFEEDDDVLEIPIFVRIEYEADATGDELGIGLGDREKKEKRELAYWLVLGVGKIAK